MTQKETVKWGLHLKTIEKCYRNLETLVNNFLLITNVAKTSVLDCRDCRSAYDTEDIIFLELYF